MGLTVIGSRGTALAPPLRTLVQPAGSRRTRADAANSRATATGLHCERHHGRRATTMPQHGVRPRRGVLAAPGVQTRFPISLRSRDRERVRMCQRVDELEQT